MKKNPLLNLAPDEIATDLSAVWQAWSRRKYPLYLFLALCFNVVLASSAFAATSVLSRPQVYALSLLGLGTVALSIYLFVVMFQPEKF